MCFIKRTVAAIVSAAIAVNMLTVCSFTAYADTVITVNGKVTIAVNLDADEGEDGVGGIGVYSDASSAPLAVSDENGLFSVTLPAGESSLTFSNHTFENGEHAASSDGCTIDRTVTVNASTDVYGAVIPVIVCDYNGDGSVSGADKAYFLSALNSTNEDANWNPYCNLNGDNSISGADKAFFLTFSGNVINGEYSYPELVLSGHAHSYDAVVTAPTCTQGGYTTYTCSICGDNYTADETAALGHTPSEAVRENESEASCTQAGSYESVVYCSVCGAELSRDTVTVDALGHSFGEWTVTAAAVEPTCTTAGATAIETRSCSRCGETETRGGETISATGHSYDAVVTAPTCTQGGYTTYTCSICGDNYTADETAALGHTPAEAVRENESEASCTQAGSYESVVYCSVCGAELSRDTVTVDALGHSFGEWTVTTAAVEPTCTTAGATAVETRSCSRCGETETRGGETISATGHSYDAVVTAPTCTQGGYTTYTCSVCGDNYTADETAALGHSWGEWVVTTPATYTNTGVKTKTCSRCGAAETEVIPVIEHIDNIDVKLENVDSYLYRAGNANNIAMSSLFKAADENKTIDASGVSVTISSIAGNAGGTFTKNSSDWTASSLKFTGTGVVKVTVKQFNAQAGEDETAAELLLEIVAGTNYADGATLASVNSNNAVLLGDVIVTNKTGMSINNGKTLYGNGFSVSDSRSDTGTTSGYINMSGNGSIDNARCLGQVYPSAVTSGTTNQYYAPGIWITGNANIYNSYVREAKNAVQIDGGTVNLVNSTFDGGAISNIQIGGGNVTLKNCITTSSTNGGLKGLGIRGTSADCKINIEGTLTQYNWLKSSDLPSTYSSVLSSVYNDSNYAYNYNGTKYVNMGIFFITDASSITAEMAQAAVNDSTSNTYGYTEKTAYSITGTLYTAKASMGSAEMLVLPTYSPTANGQYYTLPAHSFNYTLNDFSTDDKNYCTYNSTTGITQISFEEGSSMNWNSSILTVTKNGASLPVTVTMNGTDYTGQSIPFTQAGDYTVNYTYTDPYNYDKDGNVFSVTYTKSVEISVAVVEHGVEIYHPDFTYADIGGATASRQVEATVSGAKRIYVMPDVTATSSTIESKTVGGQTVYYPVVQVPASNSSGGNFSSGQLYYFAPAFKNINIVDYDQSNQTTKTAKYTYNSSTQKWPHNVNASSQPDTSVYYYTATNTSSNTNRPYGRSMNEQYYGYKYVSSRGGLCFSSNQIEKENNANSQLVEFYYKGTDDITYYYYIKYSFAYGKGSSGGCVADGSLVTMADGTKKPVEDVQVGDMVRTWSFYKGCYENKPIVANMYHGTKEWDVLKLNFSDGSNLDIIYDHGLFDADLNSNVYINAGNVERYIGDEFIQDGENRKVKLTGYEIITETAGAYAPLTAENNNCYINGLYTICSEEECSGLFEHFEIGEGMKYDEAKMQADIEKYGVYTYEDLSDCMSEEMFNAINAKYYKISAAKHGIERDEIARIFNQYM